MNIILSAAYSLFSCITSLPPKCTLFPYTTLFRSYQLIDTFWLGRLGANAVAAVSLSFPILFLILSLGGGLTLAGSVIVAQAKGARNQKNVNYSSSQTVFVIFFLSIFLSVVIFYVSEPLMQLVGA